MPELLAWNAWFSWWTHAKCLDHGVSRFSLRFKDVSTEVEFARFLKGTLLDSLFMVGCLVFALGLCRLVLEWLLVDIATPAYPEWRTDLHIICLLAMGYSMALVIFSKSRFSRLLPAFVAEAAADVYIITLMTLATFFQPQTMAALRGHSLPGCTEDTALVLFLLCCVLSTNLVLSVRWHLSIPTQLAAVVNYLIHSFVLGGASCQDLPDLDVYGPKRVWVLLILTMLLGATSKAKRVSEIQARELFLHVIRERTRRVQSEFQLDQLHRSEARPASSIWGNRTLASEPGSVPATSTTARIFELDAEVGADRVSQLTRVAELGREEHWLIEPAALEWVPGQILGTGGFAILVPGMYLGKRVAVKVPKASPSTIHSESPVLGFCNELKILRNLVHPHIVSFYGACVDVQFTDIALVTELVDGLPLREFVQKPSSHGDRARILLEVSGALCYLHGQSPRIVHGDLKDTNIMVQHGGPDASWGAAKLLDFGLARQITKRARPMGGSIRWMAPEVVLSGVPDIPADVFSFGRVAFFVLTGVQPADGKTPGEIRMHLESGLPPPLLWPPTDTFSVKYQDIIQQCGMANSTLRPGISQVQQICTVLWRECTDGNDHVGQRVHQDLHVELQALRRAASLWERSMEV